MGLAAVAVVEKVAAMMEHRMMSIPSQAGDHGPRFRGTGFDLRSGAVTWLSDGTISEGFYVDTRPWYPFRIQEWELRTPADVSVS